jgi:hypothetical protein
VAEKPFVTRVEQPRLLTMSTWFLWIVVSAAIPMLGVVRAVLMQRNFGHHIEGQMALLTVAVIVLSSAPAILRWAVLRRLAPNLSFTWVGASWAWWIIALFLWSAWIHSGINGERAFNIARARAAAGGEAIPWAWLRLTFDAAVVALIFDIVPLLMLGRLAKRSSRDFLIATITGACIAVLLYKRSLSLDNLMMDWLDAPVGFTQAQYPWDWLTRIILTASMFGMIQGAISGYGLIRMFTPPTPDGGRSFPKRSVLALVS